MSAPKATFVTAEEYLRGEERAIEKSEYHNGHVIAWNRTPITGMPGATEAHILIAGSIEREIGNLFKQRDCRAYGSDMRVRTPSRSYYYPDVSALCGPSRFESPRKTTLLNPTLIVEVLSPGTERFDSGSKFDAYCEIETLTDYVLVAQDEILVEHRQRQPDGAWRFHFHRQVDEALVLESLACRVALLDIYDKIAFASDV